MLLRSSISTTKKFFQKTLNNVKSLFSGGYHRLPKTPPHYSVAAGSVLDMKNNHPSYRDDLDKLDQFYSDFTEKWGSEHDKAIGRNKKTDMFSSHTRREQEISVSDGNFVSYSKASPVKKSSQTLVEYRREYNKEDRMQILNQQRTRKQVDSSYASKCIFRDPKKSVLAQKLKELEMLDKGNVDYVLDIEEVLHYYTRLTCPVYLEIVDKFFMDMYAELFSHAGPSAAGVMNSVLSLRCVKS